MASETSEIAALIPVDEIKLPSDRNLHTYILIHYASGGHEAYVFRFGAINDLHADVAEKFARDELEISVPAIESSNYLQRPVKGYSVAGAGEFRINSQGVFEFRPYSAAYPSDHVDKLTTVLEKHNLKLRLASEDQFVPPKSGRR